ncbi:NitT/TauT family transport system substrate-binding protein/sulfonate transport system substrate-binding protein [Haloactinopolyspora alba]|uniref:NitT/TauT family transport system substrate-binding protein/sulfonate transport system substrate-binding protein n=1 Tax=Haloactinopolyspora alba TaxID=648780 RepID=A0A2P8E2F2_9ACTN|nr:NrtA/SsuA/CpmA family ABC transporter substrate-binding protein [Haloactinopolyspora alba]PSL03642.1 NitT/TauT family transport system substrate-binding protein/sulfonate transport system substrate-binding protein [Haloactinopolyspora alba]
MLSTRRAVAGATAALAVCAALTSCGGSDDDSGGGSSGGGATAEGEAQISAGMVGAIDQIGLPAALDKGYFEAAGVRVEVQEPFATGVDMLNALDTGQIDIAQVGTPLIGAVLSGADYVILGNYTGSASQLGIDETMAVMARADSGIKEDDLSTLAGKKVGVAVGSINHLYLLAALKEHGMTPEDVEIVNTAPPDMGVALQTSGIDAAIVWDPWPLLIEQQVEGAYEVTRGGGYIGFIGYLVAEREWAEQHPDLVKRFLTARAAADQWMRKNPDDAAGVASRWLSNLDPAIAKEAMQHNIQQLDPRISACNYAALNSAMTTLHDLGSIDDTFDPASVFEPAAINEVVSESPELFEDLPPIPESAEVTEDFSFDPSARQCGS